MSPQTSAGQNFVTALKKWSIGGLFFRVPGGRGGGRGGTQPPPPPRVLADLRNRVSQGQMDPPPDTLQKHTPSEAATQSWDFGPLGSPILRTGPTGTSKMKKGLKVDPQQVRKGVPYGTQMGPKSDHNSGYDPYGPKVTHMVEKHEMS